MESAEEALLQVVAQMEIIGADMAAQQRAMQQAQASLVTALAQVVGMPVQITTIGAHPQSGKIQEIHFQAQNGKTGVYHVNRSLVVASSEIVLPPAPPKEEPWIARRFS